MSEKIQIEFSIDKVVSNLIANGQEDLKSHRHWESVEVILYPNCGVLMLHDGDDRFLIIAENLRKMSRKHPQPVRIRGRSVWQAVRMAGHGRGYEIWLVSENGSLYMELRQGEKSCATISCVPVPILDPPGITFGPHAGHLTYRSTFKQLQGEPLNCETEHRLGIKGNFG